MKARLGLLVSGGIGDFIHYIARMPTFLTTQNIVPESLTIFVEATQPAQVAGLFRRCLPEMRVLFVPSSLHWTKTNPLLNVDRARDRAERPAFRYTAAKVETLVDDWFLPFLCRQYQIDSSRIDFIRPGPSAERDLSVCVSVRDKGFLWWPSEEALSLVRRLIPQKYRVLWCGTPDEQLHGGPPVTTATDVLAALSLSCAADLFVGTDTGLATAREILGLPNIYCVSEYWFEDLMVRYSYWTDEMNGRSRSRFAFDLGGLEAGLRSFYP